MRLLVVDDDPEMLYLACHLLGLAPGFRVYRALGGPAGLEAARRERPDAVMADFRMPGLDGMGLLRGVRAEQGMEGTPFIFCSGKREEELRPALGGAAVSGFIVKPFDPGTLARDVSGLLGRPAA